MIRDFLGDERRSAKKRTLHLRADLGKKSSRPLNNLWFRRTRSQRTRVTPVAISEIARRGSAGSAKTEATLCNEPELLSRGGRQTVLRLASQAPQDIPRLGGGGNFVESRHRETCWSVTGGRSPLFVVAYSQENGCRGSVKDALSSVRRYWLRPWLHPRRKPVIFVVLMP